MTTISAPGRCIACGGAPHVALRLTNGRPLLQCSRCRLGWWDWPPFDPAAFYDEGYFQSATVARGYDDYAALTGGLRRTARARLRRIERGRTHLPGAPPPRLLEIGCGPGVFLDVAAAAGWQVEGIEVSAYAAEQARQRGHNVRCGPVETRLLPVAAYDCVALWDVLEHLRDPAGVLRAAARSLRFGGVLALSTGDVTSLCARLSGARWHLFNLPEHLFFFSPGALTRLLAQAGCRVMLWTREVTWLPVAYLLERLRKSVGSARWTQRSACSGAAAPHIDPTRAAATAWGRVLLPATLLDVLGVYAVRRGEGVGATTP